jgi:hypothetical protein
VQFLYRRDDHSDLFLNARVNSRLLEMPLRNPKIAVRLSFHEFHFFQFLDATPNQFSIQSCCRGNGTQVAPPLLRDVHETLFWADGLPVGGNHCRWSSTKRTDLCPKVRTQAPIAFSLEQRKRT